MTTIQPDSLPSFHPVLDHGIKAGDPSFSGGALRCHCSTDPVVIELSSNVAYNHACGCSKCWKPAGAIFSIVAVVPTADVSVISGAKKLAVVDPSATILRHACRDCGVHMYGPVEADHAFKGLSFVHTELSPVKGWQEPQFAAFVSSIIESGFNPKLMDAARAQFEKIGLPTYDVLSPQLMDLQAVFAAKKTGRLYADA